jgi:disulfide bond formation protein DsbB
MHNYINTRSLLLFLTLLSFGLFGASLYFQYVEHMEPCPLCVAQRISILLLAFTYLFALFTKRPTLKAINTFFQFLFSIFGASMAARHVWLIHTPALQRPGCLPELSLLWKYLPFKDVLHAFLNGTESCVENTWALLGLSMPEWTLGFFVFFIIASIVLVLKNSKTER